MPEEQKQPGSFGHWAGVFAACVGVVAALIGLATAAINGWSSFSKNVSSNPPVTEAARQPDNDTKSQPQVPITRERTLPSQAQPAANGTCDLPGDWEFVMDGQNPSDKLDLPAKFSGGSFVITGLTTEISSDCIHSRDAITLIPPDVNFLGDQTNIIIMMMPKHYRKEGDNTYAGNTSGTNFYIRRR